MSAHSRCLLVAAALLLAACDNAPDSTTEGAPTGTAEPISDHQLFFDRIAELCGMAFAGKVLKNEPPQEDDQLADQPLVMHVRECSDDRINIALHVGDDRSRSWIITLAESGIDAMDGLRLEHAHHRPDGSPAEVTMYGGDTALGGSATRQEFPVNEESRALFERNGMNPSMVNTWAIEIEPDQRFLYELTRPEGRILQLEFDLTKTVPLPPAPWGYALTKIPPPDETEPQMNGS